MADQPKTNSGGSRHCSRVPQGENKPKKNKHQQGSPAEFICRRVTRRSLQLGDTNLTNLGETPPESLPTKKRKVASKREKKSKQKTKLNNSKTTLQKEKCVNSETFQTESNRFKTKPESKPPKKRKTKSQSTTNVLDSIARNLRSNSSASIVEGIPYHKVKEIPSKTEEHLSVVQTSKPKYKRKRKNSKIDTDEKKNSQECSANPAKKPRLNFSVRVQISGEEQVSLKQETSVARSRKQKSNTSLSNNSPELDSFRQSLRTKKTGSCASSRSRRASSTSSKKRGTRASQLSSRTTEETNKAQCSNPMSDQDSSENAADRSGRTQGEDAAQSAVASSSVSAAAVTSESESEDPDMGRLQALLEARGLPTHLFGSLGPRMHQLLHRTMAGGTMSKVQQLLQGLQTSGDEGQQLTAVIEMCQLLVMGNEDTLAGFPVKQVVPALITLLQMEHNFDMMHHACRALTYMMEALPRSSTVVVDAVPVFLEKLQAIQCMDVAEQSLTALEMLSRRHSKAILQANGISACLMYLDFFGINAQRCALMVTANCVQNITADEFHYVRDNLSLLSSRLNHQDKKSCESCCLCFAKLVDNFQHDQRILKEIAVHDCLTNIQQLLVVSPPLISSGTFVTVLRMLATMCASCPDLAVVLLKQKIAETLSYLLIGATDNLDKSTQTVELISRSPQELYELVCLIGELLPKLPNDGIFAVDSLMRKGGSLVTDAVTWQWKDDRGMWHSYHLMDNRIIEAAHQANEDEVSLTTMGRAYTIDFNAMQQINEDSGTARTIQRKVNHSLSGTTSHSTSASSSEVDVERCDSRAEILKEDDNLASNFMQTLFAVLYEVYSSSAGPTVRHKCLQTLLRMIYYGSADLLREVLKNQPVSSHIAAMMASNDLRVTVGAIQIAQILIEKLPDIFSVVFRREGVFHQIKKLSEMEPQPSPPLKPAPISSSSSSLSSSTTTSSSASSHSRESLDRKDIDTTPYTLAATGNDEDQPSSHQMRLSDVLKRKKRGANRKSARGDDSPIDIGTKSSSGGCGKVTRGKLNAKESKVSGSTPKMSFLPSLNPRTWGSRFGSSSSTDRSSVNKARTGKESGFSRSPALVTTPNNKEKVRVWIKEQASRLLKDYFNAEAQGNSHPALSVLNRLSITAEALSLEEESLIQHLEDVAEIMRSSDVSPFEIIHSGLVNKLLQYLTSVSGTLPRELRLRRFLHVFLNCPTSDVTYVKKLSLSPEMPPPISFLMSKLTGCLHQLEQFQVKVHDLPGGSNANGRGSNAIRFFNTHQIKCNLQRHPSCNTLRQWKGGPVKIDPLALVQAIERYLLMRGYGRLKNEGEEDISEEDNSDEDADDTMAAMFISQTQTRHRLEFLMGDNLLPYNMTVYQAIKQFNVPSDKDGNETDTDTENPFGNASIWVQTHTIWYRPCLNPDEAVPTSTKKTKGESKVHRPGRKKDELWTEGHCPIIVSSLNPYLTDKLPVFVTVQDPCLEVITLLRLIYAVNRYWHTMYESSDLNSSTPALITILSKGTTMPTDMRKAFIQTFSPVYNGFQLIKKEVSFFPTPVLSSNEFISSKLTAKANRQLQDPLVIMTGNLPAWLAEIANAAPFLFPFDTRQLLFYATTFDRDRAMMRLQDNSMEPSSNDNTERVSLRLEKRKRTVNRTDLLKQAEKVMDEIGTSRALLEIQYENEVGTGLGPTLEFYSLVSRDVQRVGLEMWRGDVNKNSDYSGKDLSDISYIHSPSGLFPAPLGRTAKASLVNKLKCKFKFLGKFIAKALMDSRMIDIPFSIVFYKWLLGQEHNLSSSDLHHIDVVIAKSYSQLEEVLRQKKRIEADKTHTEESRQLALASLSMDGCSIEDLDLDFTFPGYPNIELKKGGKDSAVSLHNLEEYLQLVAHWTLVEGVSRQFEAFRDGFDSVFPLATLQCFYPEELDQLFCGNVSETWDIKMLMECCRPDHGYNHDSRAVKFLFEILNSFTATEQRAFLQFTTGSARLPVGGFKSLNPPLTIVRKTFEATENPDSFLPSVMTCVNYLKLPDYSTIDIMRDKLSIATKEGQLSFHLS